MKTVVFLTLITLFVSLVDMLNLLPCPENISREDRERARAIIQQSTPPGFVLAGVRSEVRLGRNPHRWIGVFHPTNGVYDSGCVALVYLKQEFRRIVPMGSDLSSVRVTNNNTVETIEVEYLVNCRCRRLPRRKRSSYPECTYGGYTRESGFCRK